MKKKEKEREEMDDGLPKNAFMLLSFINTRLRNDCVGLDDLCRMLDVPRETIEERLRLGGFTYNEEQNRFW